MKDPKKIITFFIILIAISGTIYMLTNAKAFGVTGESSNDKLEKQLYTSILAIQNVTMENAYLLNNRKFWPGVPVKTVSGDSVNIAKDLGGKRVMVMQFADQNCSVCVDSAIYHFKKFAAEIGEDNVALVDFTDDLRVYAQFIRVQQLKFGHYYATTSHVKDSLYRVMPNFPIFYMLDSDARMTDVFFPVKEFTDRTEAYLHAMRQKYYQ